MASGGPPDSLNSRHYEIAALDAAGYTNVEIARILEINANRISIIKQSPLYAALLGLERKKLADLRRESVVGRFEELTDLAIETKRDCLEQRDNLAVANAAADSVLDRVMPRKKGDEGGERVLHVKLSVDEVARLRRTMLEDADDIDVTPPGLTPLAAAIVDAVAPEEDDESEAVA